MGAPFSGRSRWCRELPELAMIEQLQEFPANVVAFACKGRVTQLDYQTVLMPAVEGALLQHDRLRLYYQIDADFSGIDAGAMWEDFKVGIEHLTRWERIAVVTDVDWIRHTIRAFRFLIPGTVKIFPLDQAAKAREWIIAAGFVSGYEAQDLGPSARSR